ncbi:hypothetical protein EDD19_14012 [Dietzia cinnamea]|uniref:Uncharacterized protein n=1 Tax=Dietzia cinnamea TaxID=321318 RepID=A0A4R3ZQH5_9ACTN|nr:hypothetical protein EDD19_14012 [Dietzia cinnamea]
MVLGVALAGNFNRLFPSLSLLALLSFAFNPPDLSFGCTQLYFLQDLGEVGQ